MKKILLFSLLFFFANALSAGECYSSPHTYNTTKTKLTLYNSYGYAVNATASNGVVTMSSLSGRVCFQDREYDHDIFVYAGCPSGMGLDTNTQTCVCLNSKEAFTPKSCPSGSLNPPSCYDPCPTDTTRQPDGSCCSNPLGKSCDLNTGMWSDCLCGGKDQPLSDGTCPDLNSTCPSGLEKDRFGTCVEKCPAGEYRDKTNECSLIPSCPSGQIFNKETALCEDKPNCTICLEKHEEAVSVCESRGQTLDTFSCSNDATTCEITKLSATCKDIPIDNNSSDNEDNNNSDDSNSNDESDNDNSDNNSNTDNNNTGEETDGIEDNSDNSVPDSGDNTSDNGNDGTSAGGGNNSSNQTSGKDYTDQLNEISENIKNGTSKLSEKQINDKLYQDAQLDDNQKRDDLLKGIKKNQEDNAKESKKSSDEINDHLKSIEDSLKHTEGKISSDDFTPDISFSDKIKSSIKEGFDELTSDLKNSISDKLDDIKERYKADIFGDGNCPKIPTISFSLGSFGKFTIISQSAIDNLGIIAILRPVIIFLFVFAGVMTALKVK